MTDAGSAKEMIAELANKNGTYIIVSGKDDCSDAMLTARQNGMKEAVVDLPNRDNILLHFYGRDRISTWLRQHPGVSLWTQSRLGKPLSGWMPFGRWTNITSEQDDEFFLDDHPCVIDVNSHSKEPVTLVEGIKLVRDRLRQLQSSSDYRTIWRWENSICSSTFRSGCR